MTDQELGARIVETTSCLKRAVAEREAYARSLAEKVRALQDAGRLAERLLYDASRGIVVDDESRDTVSPWPTHDELRQAFSWTQKLTRMSGGCGRPSSR